MTWAQTLCSGGPLSGRLLAGLVLFGLLLTAPASGYAHELAPDERLPRYAGARRVARELVTALEAGNLETFDALVRAPSPSMITVASTLLNPPGREPTDTERSVLKRMLDKAGEGTGVAAFVTYWQKASDKTRSAERTRWGLSARFVMRLRGGKEKAALAVLEPELESLRNAAYSHQASDILRSYTHFLLQKRRFQDAEPELRGLARHLHEEKRFHEELPILFMLAHALRGASRSADAMPVYERAQALAERLGRWRHAGTAALERGLHAKLTGDLDASGALLHYALAVATSSSDVAMARRARVWLARLARARGRPLIAERHAVGVFEAGKDEARPNVAADAASMLVLLLRDHGRMAEALRYGAWLEDNLERVTSSEARGVARRALAKLAIRRAARDEAHVHLERALDAFSESPVGQRGTLSVLTDLISWQVAAPEAVAAYLAEHRRLVQQQAHGARAGWILADAARLERSFGDPAVARALADRALEAARASSDALARHRGIAGKADDLASEGSWQQALALYEEARAAAPEDSQHAQRYRVDQGRCLIALGRPKDAVTRLRAVLRSGASVRRGVSDRDALGLRAQEHAISALGMRAALAWQEQDPEAAPAAAAVAWWFREHGSARLLAESLVVDGRTGRADLDDRLTKAMEAVEATQRKLIVVIARGETARQAALRTTLNEQHARLHRIGRRVTRGSMPAVFDVTTLEEIRAALGDTDAVLSYAVADRVVYGIAVDRGGARFAQLGRADEIRALVARWKTLASTPAGPDAKLAVRLYVRLIRPLEARLAERSNWTVLVEGPLAGIPIDAFLRVENGRSERLIERHTVIYAHSASVRAALAARAARRIPAHGAVLLGDPKYPTPERVAQMFERPTLAARLRGGLFLPRLPASAGEVRQVAALFPASDRVVLLGGDATGEKLMAALRARTAPLRVLHLACHGIVDDQLPTLSGLVFAGGSVLTAERLEALRIDTDLAVLSACDSGAGKSTVGEGVLGLTRALFLAGASRVLCSTWQVADESTSTLMVRFHEGRERKHMPTAQALRAARLSLLHDPQTAHPFHWAGLQLWGVGAK